jgi:hypothetical protein
MRKLHQLHRLSSLAGELAVATLFDSSQAIARQANLQDQELSHCSGRIHHSEATRSFRCCLGGAPAHYWPRSAPSLFSKPELACVRSRRRYAHGLATPCPGHIDDDHRTTRAFEYGERRCPEHRFIPHALTKFERPGALGRDEAGMRRHFKTRPWTPIAIYDCRNFKVLGWLNFLLLPGRENLQYDCTP